MKHATCMPYLCAVAMGGGGAIRVNVAGGGGELTVGEGKASGGT